MRDMLLVLNFDRDFSRNIARKLRNEHYYCQIVPRDITLAQVQALSPSGILLAGGMVGRGQDKRQGLDVRLLEMGVPVLAMGNCARTMLSACGGSLGEKLFEKRTAHVHYEESPLFAQVEDGERWMEHAHELVLPDSLIPIAEAEAAVIGFAHREKPLFGLQFQVEKNDPDGISMLVHFVQDVCKCTPWWSVEVALEQAEQELARAAAGTDVLCAVSGGVDSAVCAALAKRTLEGRAHCVLIDTGLMRAGEVDEVRSYFEIDMRLELKLVDARAQVLEALRGVEDGEQKRRKVEAVCRQVLVEEAQQLENVGILMQGTNYSDVIRREQLAEEAAQYAGPMRIIEPLRNLFKDEVREAGEKLGLPPSLITRQPFPTAGLAMRMIGQVDMRRLHVLRSVDEVFSKEIHDAGQDRKLWKHFCVLAACPSTPGERETVVLRAVYVSDTYAFMARLPYDLLERVVERIMDLKLNIDRVLYDMTPSIYAPVEWQ